ncbi:hypothetical protein V0U79_07640 [Hyphobacterium sp. HN65]|uniref:Uncharacterized protein n=1 Tax=Hyphobacterium lacteum TaxID=3116575 RepID=A0ABU7LQP0_9PROT|nr:hypothetical protein [Hyphobacterium sp. HN65]MEE2526235.1 hypothetical protein [Hyphobacterium sp. HN65]
MAGRKIRPGGAWSNERVYLDDEFLDELQNDLEIVINQRIRAMMNHQARTFVDFYENEAFSIEPALEMLDGLDKSIDNFGRLEAELGKLVDALFLLPDVQSSPSAVHTTNYLEDLRCRADAVRRQLIKRSTSDSRTGRKTDFWLDRLICGLAHVADEIGIKPTVYYDQRTQTETSIFARFVERILGQMADELATQDGYEKQIAVLRKNQSARIKRLKKSGFEMLES